MRIVHLRASASCGLCFALAVTGAGCINDQSPEAEASASSAIVLDPSASYSLVGVQSNKCVGVVGASLTAGARLEIETCRGIASQRFRPEAMGSGFFRMRNELSGLCVDVSGASLADGAAVIQWTCHTGFNQQWAFTDVSPGAERVTARHSGKVLDVTGQATADGTLVEQWSSNGGNNQRFVMPEAVPALVP